MSCSCYIGWISCWDFLFTADVLQQTGLEIETSGRLHNRMASKCTLCGHVMTNVLQRWLKHAKRCLLKFKGSKSAARGIALCDVGAATPTAFQVQIHSAAEHHRKKLCDTYVIVYWMYKHNITFNTGPKLKKVPPNTHTTFIIVYSFHCFTCSYCCT